MIDTCDCLHFAKDTSDFFQAAPDWFMPARFPTPYRSGVHTQTLSQFLPGEPEDFAGNGKLLRRRPACWERVIPQEPDDFGDVKNERRGFIAFPVADGQGVYSDLLGNLLLKEPEIQAALAEVVS